MMTTQRVFTADDLFNIPDDGRRWELVRRELRNTAPAGFEHGNIGSEILHRLRQHAKAHRLGKVVGSDTGFVIGADPDVVRVPDVAFVSQARLDVTGVPVRFYPGAPDLAVEVVSPNDTADAVEEKVNDWLNAGTRRVWVVSPRHRTVTVYSPGPRAQILREGDTLSGEDVVPGFACLVGALFE